MHARRKRRKKAQNKCPQIKYNKVFTQIKVDNNGTKWMSTANIKIKIDDKVGFIAQ